MTKNGVRLIVIIVVLLAVHPSFAFSMTDPEFSVNSSTKYFWEAHELKERSNEFLHYCFLTVDNALNGKNYSSNKNTAYVKFLSSSASKVTDSQRPKLRYRQQWKK